MPSVFCLSIREGNLVGYIAPYMRNFHILLVKHDKALHRKLLCPNCKDTRRNEGRLCT